MFLAIGSVDINSLSSSLSSQLSLNCIRVTPHVHTDSVHRLVAYHALAFCMMPHALPCCNWQVVS